MREAIRLALDSARRGGGPFGAVVVRHEEIVGRGANQVTTSNDPTAHAEVIALRDACQRLQTFRLEDCELYASCEPCPMCLAAAYWARIKRILYAGTRADAAEIGFDDERIYRELARPLNERSLEMRQLLREEALAAFVQWRDQPDKTPY